jgi:tetratricopeptide (TPR) repeat protein
MSCHNAYSNHVENSLNKYHSVPDGIDCERCHGPGEIHVKEKLSGNIIDTSKYIDYTIVNPAKLSTSLQFDICRRCHLQGTSVLQNGKNWNDFIPGTALSETMDTYIPKYENDESFIMASHVDRLQQSDCFKDGGVSCISCHNPHKSVTTFDNNYFNNKCISCHVNCEETPKNMECVSCHMPKSSSTDIPHVSITDHNISVHSNSKEEKGSFKELICINNDSPTNLSKAKAYLKHYESFAQNPILLDSAFMFMKRCGKEESFPFYIQYYYLINDYKSLITYYESIGSSLKVRLFTENTLSLTYCRIAEAYHHLDIYEKSYQFYLKSVNLSPENLDFLLKTSVLEIKMSKFEQSKIRLKNIIKLNPNFDKAYYNLGLIYLNVDKDLYIAKLNFEEALKLNPDYIQAKDMIKYIESN